MRRLIGVLATEYIASGLVEDHKIAGPLQLFPEPGRGGRRLLGMPFENVVQALLEQIERVGQGQEVEALGVGFPGLIREGIVEESPNLQQMKGFHLQAALSVVLKKPVLVVNDADAMAAGIAATYGQLDKLIRVWMLGTGIGFGRYPQAEGVWEGGHTVVSLDPKEQYCGCGGVGHLEGIMGHRAMRLRFLDMEPEEIFANAKAGDARCSEFVKLWHRALAAATASSIHMDGPGKFFITGHNAKFLDLGLLNMYLHEMVKMSTLQGYFFEVVPMSDEIAVIGAAVNAERAAFGE